MQHLLCGSGFASRSFRLSSLPKLQLDCFDISSSVRHVRFAAGKLVRDQIWRETAATEINGSDSSDKHTDGFYKKKKKYGL